MAGRPLGKIPGNDRQVVYVDNAIVVQVGLRNIIRLAPVRAERNFHQIQVGTGDDPVSADVSWYRFDI